MSRKAFEKIAEGLHEAIAVAQGNIGDANAGRRWGPYSRLIHTSTKSWAASF